MTGPELLPTLLLPTLLVVALSCACAVHAAHSNRALTTPPIWLRLKYVI